MTHATPSPGCRQYLRPAGAPALRATDTSVLAGSTPSAEVWVDPGLGERGLEVAAGVLSHVEPDVAAISAIFQGTRPPGRLRIVLARSADAARAYHDRCEPTTLYCDVETMPVPQPLYSCFLLATQLVEIIAEAHGEGWAGDTAHGEALSRAIAAGLYPRRLAGFATAATWLRGERRDYLGTAVPGDGDDAAIGCSALFLHYLHTELDYSWPQIVAAGAPDLASTYRRVTGTLDDPFPRFASALAEAFPKGKAVMITGDNPYPLPESAPTSPTALAASAPGGAGPAAPTIEAAPQPSAPAAAPRLADVLANRRWYRCDTPFPHLRAENVFQPELAAALERDFLARLERDELKRNLPGYDASALGLTAETAGAFAVFLGREWHDLLAGLFGVAGSGDVIATLHHHAPGSLSGSAHNDLNPGWFLAEPPLGPDDVRVHDPAKNGYRNGHSPTGEPTVERVRAIAMLYYLATPEGVRGGGTGFYRNGHQPLDQADSIVPPRNNSLVAFECTPYSFHSFLQNFDQPRNCLAFWLHRSKDDAIARWGANSIIGWA